MLSRNYGICGCVHVAHATTAIRCVHPNRASTYRALSGLRLRGHESRIPPPKVRTPRKQTCIKSDPAPATSPTRGRVLSCKHETPISPVKLTFLEGVECTPDRGRCLDIEPGAFLDFISDRAKCPSTECLSEADKLAGSGFVLASYRPGARSKRNDELAPGSSTGLLCFDVDGMTLAELREAAPLWMRTDCTVYSTWKHTEEAPRLRVLVRLSREVPNAQEHPFRQIYQAAALGMGIKADPRASNRANFYFGPQHKPGASTERRRFKGAALSVEALLRVDLPNSSTAVAEALETASNRPDRSEVRALSKRLKRRKKDRDQLIGLALDAIVKGDPFAPVGSVHNTTLQVAFELVREFPHLDAEWFAGNYLGASWTLMWPGERTDRALEDWRKCVSSASSKFADARAARATERADFQPEQVPELTEEELRRAQVARRAEALIAEYRGNYYVYDPRVGEYRGPVKSSGVPTAFRMYLAGTPTVSETEFRENAPPALKSAVKLTHEYGREIDAVHYYAKTPSQPWTHNAIQVRAYSWNEWPAVYHRCADELLRAMAGDRYRLLEAWLFKVRDLDQALPALTLVGPPGTWKSRLSQTLSRFWGDRSAPTACRAEHVLRRFSGPLLGNPVIWSDEALALTEMGKSMPERYRESISELSHQIERKGQDPVTLHSATRHVISVNDEEKVFSVEVDSHSVEATIARFLVVRVDSERVMEFERRWERTRELGRLREGSSLLEHVRWLEENTVHVSEGRFFVATDTDPEMLRKARFADEVLTVCILIAIEALLLECKMSRPGALDRLPMFVDEEGTLRIAPARIAELWADSKATASSGLRKPTPARIGRTLTKAGFKVDDLERANNNQFGGWAARVEIVKSFVDVDGTYSWENVNEACKKVFGLEIQ